MFQNPEMIEGIARKCSAVEDAGVGIKEGKKKQQQCNPRGVKAGVDHRVSARSLHALWEQRSPSQAAFPGAGVGGWGGIYGGGEETPPPCSTIPPPPHVRASLPAAAGER